MKIFITGGTGFLGREVLVRMLHKNMGEKIFILIRPNHKHSAAERLEILLDKTCSGDLRQRASEVCVAVSGDLTQDGLGLSALDREMVSKEVNRILHVGASTDFSAPLDISRLYNVQGTRHVLDLARLCQDKGTFDRFDYVSTAFVAGIRRGRVKEDDLDRGQAFANNYERTKFEAETLVRSYMQHFPICIMRPSIVVGNSVTGFTPHFKVLYWPLKILAKNILPFAPVSGRATLDVVPVDYVADGMVELFNLNEASNNTFYLTAGMGNEINIAKLMKDATKFAGINSVPRIPLWCLSLIRRTFLARVVSKEVWEVIEIAKTYTAYCAGKGVYFDSKKTDRLLREKGISPKKWDDYAETIMKFCTSSRWGKRLPKKEAEYYREALSS